MNNLSEILTALVHAIIFFILLLFAIAFLVHICAKNNCWVDAKFGKNKELKIHPQRISSSSKKTHTDRE